MKVNDNRLFTWDIDEVIILYGCMTSKVIFNIWENDESFVYDSSNILIFLFNVNDILNVFQSFLFNWNSKTL